MDDVGRYLWGTIFFILLTIIAMVFSSSETAISFISEGKLKKLSEEGSKKSASILKFKGNQFDFCLYLNTSAMFSTTAACLVGTYIYAPALQDLLENFIGSVSLANTLSIITLLLLLSFIAFVFGQTLPKKLALNKPESYAFRFIGTIKFLGYIFKPLTYLTIKTTKILSDLLGIDPNFKNIEFTEEEIRMLVDAGNENGTIKFSEREMINNIFEFDDRTVAEIMTHRTDIVAVEKNDGVTDVITAAIDEGFSRIPVYDDDIDDIEGIIYVKDFLALIGNDDVKTKKIEDFMRPVVYVPESARCRVLFKELKEKKTHMAVVVDEYGGTAGIVTMEDLIESIVGNIQDEYDEEEDEIKKLEENVYSLDGGLNLEAVEKLFSISLDPDEDTETVGGLIVNTLGRIPLEDEETTVVIGGIEFTVLQVEDRRVKRVRAVKLSENDFFEDDGDEISKAQ